MLDFLRQNNALRDSTLVAVGGGITGDVAAFAASVYMRGIKLIQVPTTLLAMVDSSVGGKTAVNFKGIKNNIGSFYQPSMVLIDSHFLDSLTDKEYSFPNVSVILSGIELGLYVTYLTEKCILH